MKNTLLIVVATAIVLGTATRPSLAQDLPAGPRGESVAYSMNSGLHANDSTFARSVFHHVVHAPDAAWLRLHFADLALEDRSTIRMTSLQDGEVQELDAGEAVQWGNSSAYFNGDSVLVELLAAPRTANNHVTIEQITVEFNGWGPQPVGSSGQCGICGVDDRVPSNELWSARLMPVGCTASVINSCSCMVSAGHCVSGGMVVQFNVPNSLPNCAMVNPPVADQFPITAFSYSAVDIGNDWSVLKPGTNSLGQRPYDRYGVFMPVATTAAAVGNSVSLWGYGMDTNCVNNQRQQTSSGAVNVVAPTFFQFSADLRAGNSGTGIIRNGQVLGVATNCMVACPNVASSMNIPGFVVARSTLCACGFTACPADVSGDSQVNLTDLLQVIQHWGACPPPPSVCMGDIVLVPPAGVNVQDVLAVIDGWGACP